jgi:putative SOS response-associated peptidase YedK
MLFAGLYDSVTLEGEHQSSMAGGVQESIFDLLIAGGVGAGQSEPLWTFTIVTTAASSSSSWLHDRQPVILTSQDALDRWLDTSTQTWEPKLSPLLDPYNDSDTPLEWCVLVSPHTFALIHMYMRPWWVNSHIATPCREKSAK